MAKNFKEQADEEDYDDEDDYDDEEEYDDEENYDDEEEYDDEEGYDDEEEASPAEEEELSSNEEEENIQTIEADAEEQQATEEESENTEVCSRCGYEGTLLCCDFCPEMYHIECIEPPPSLVFSESEWLCHRCRIKQGRKNSNPNNNGEVTSSRRSNRREAESRDDLSLIETEVREETAEAASEEQQKTEKDSKHEEVCTICGVGGTLLVCYHCPEMYHIECAPLPPRRVLSLDGLWLCRRCRAKSREEQSHSDSNEQVTSSRRSSQRETESRDDLPLHNAPLQELLSDVLKQNSAWPFLRPVQKAELPDYYDIITKPMDFGTIKNKLTMEEYKCDADLMADAVLVFENCKTYNNTADEVYKCGITLLKYFVNRCQELDLKWPEELLEKYDDNLEPPALKKKRTK